MQPEVLLKQAVAWRELSEAVFALWSRPRVCISLRLSGFLLNIASTGEYHIALRAQWFSSRHTCSYDPLVKSRMIQVHVSEKGKVALNKRSGILEVSHDIAHS
jgi:hypothetical protein